MDLENGWDIRYHQWRWIDKITENLVENLKVSQLVRDRMLSWLHVDCRYPSASCCATSVNQKKNHFNNKKTCSFRRESIANNVVISDRKFIKFHLNSCDDVCESWTRNSQKFYETAETARVDNINVSWIGAMSFQGYSAVFHLSFAQLFNTHTSLCLEHVEKWNTEIASFLENPHQIEYHPTYFLGVL